MHETMCTRACPDGRVVYSLPLTARGLSPLPGCESRQGQGQVKKPPGLGGVFCWVLRLPQTLTNGWSRTSLNMAEKVTMFEIQIQIKALEENGLI